MLPKLPHRDGISKWRSAEMRGIRHVPGAQTGDIYDCSGVAVGRQPKGWGTVWQDRKEKRYLLSQLDLEAIANGTKRVTDYTISYLDPWSSQLTVTVLGERALYMAPRGQHNFQFKAPFQQAQSGSASVCTLFQTTNTERYTRQACASRPRAV